ncbi:hypothetical protein EsDP_00007142 [Epichloe bromicola]|uniref:non-specific serine/threonine protein kinase n=1 Tax=Epichloe bromicola TaxID=79588 RepID=A0ABQ0D041_9HYPO
MPDTDLIARVYPFSDVSHDDPKQYAAKAIMASSFYVPQLSEVSQKEVKFGRDDREVTEPPDEPGDRKESEFNGKPFLEIKFSKVPRSSHGVIFGCGMKCDVVLPDLRGLSKLHFSLTFDEQGRFIVKDLHSLLGTEVTYNGEGSGRRRRFHWIVGGDDNAHTRKKIIIKVHNHVQFRIVVDEHNAKSESYKAQVKEYCDGNATAEELFSDLDLPLRPDTELPTGVHTPHASPIYLRKEIGRGGYGVVTHCWNVSSGEEHVLKQPSTQAMFNSAKWLEEADILSRISHVFFWADLEPTPRLCLEYIPGGSLDECSRITVTESVSILRQTLSALVYLHESSPRIVHRDIKPGNILVRWRHSNEIKIVLGDFGLHGLGDVLTTMCGTEMYTPPEIWEPYVERTCQTQYSTAVDIWSLGVLMYELLLGLPAYKRYWREPLQSANSQNSQLTWCEWLVRRLWDEYRTKPDSLKQLLISSMLQLSPNNRDTARGCYRKAMALPDTIVGHGTLPNGGILWRKETIIYSSSDSEEQQTVLIQNLDGQQPKSLGAAVTASERSNSVGIPDCHPPPLLSSSQGEVQDENIAGQPWRRSGAPSPPSRSSLVLSNLKRSTTELPRESLTSKRRGQISVEKSHGYLNAHSNDAKAHEAAEAMVLLQNLRDGAHRYVAMSHPSYLLGR